MRTIKDQTLEDQAFALEDVYLVNCVVRNCTIFYGGGFALWENTSFHNCAVRLHGAARNAELVMINLGLLAEGPRTASAVTATSQTIH